jgi:hypothetical protein
VDLLLPALLLRILVALLMSRMHPYPSLETLQKRRQDALEAERIGERLEERLVVSSAGPITELIRFGRLIARSRKKKASSMVTPEPIGGDPYNRAEDVKEETDMKRAALSAVNSISDFHERIRKFCLLHFML